MNLPQGFYICLLKLYQCWTMLDRLNCVIKLLFCLRDSNNYRITQLFSSFFCMSLNMSHRNMLGECGFEAAQNYFSYHIGTMVVRMLWLRDLQVIFSTSKNLKKSQVNNLVLLHIWIIWYCFWDIMTSTIKHSKKKVLLQVPCTQGQAIAMTPTTPKKLQDFKHWNM